jgi:hypothetical protein
MEAGSPPMATVGTQSAGEKAALQMKHSSNAKSGRAEDDNLILTR